MESCFAKTAMSGVAGFGLGGIFGMFMASVCFSPLPPRLFLAYIHPLTLTTPY